MLKPTKMKSGIYYFRKMVPVHLRDKLGSEVRRSLDTKDLKTARRRMVAHEIAFDELVSEATRDENLSKMRMVEIVGKWLISSLGKDHASRIEGNPEASFKTDSEDLLPYDAFIEELQDSRHHNDLSSLLQGEAKALLSDNGIFLRAREEEVFQEFLEEFFYAKMRFYNTLNERYLGRFKEVILDLPQSTSQVTLSPNLVALMESWIEQRSPTKKSADTMDVTIKKFTKQHGELQAHEITRSMVREFRDTLSSTNSKQTGKPLAVGSINRLLSSLGALLSFGMKEGYFDDIPNWTLPTTGIRIVDKNMENLRLPFNEQDLRDIFGVTQELPVKIAYHTGARLGEIIQLTAKDIKVIRGIPVFDFNAEDGKDIKNKSSIRQVPIPNDLIDEVMALRKEQMKLSRTVNWQKRKGQLFNAKSAGTYSKHFMHILRNQAYITDPKKVFHSFRHTMKDMMRNAGIDLAIQNEILGHSSRSVGEGYGEGHSLENLSKAINLIPSIPK